jgi:hypothetical protein
LRFRAEPRGGRAVCNAEEDHQEVSPPRGLHVDGDGAHLLHLLDLLANALESIRAAEPPLDNRCGAATEQWEDEHHVYLDFCLPSECEVELDMNIHEGQAFFRIEK